MTMTSRAGMMGRLMWGDLPWVGPGWASRSGWWTPLVHLRPQVGSGKAGRPLRSGVGYAAGGSVRVVVGQGRTSPSSTPPPAGAMPWSPVASGGRGRGL